MTLTSADLYVGVAVAMDRVSAPAFILVAALFASGCGAAEGMAQHEHRRSLLARCVRQAETPLSAPLVRYLLGFYAQSMFGVNLTGGVSRAHTADKVQNPASGRAAAAKELNGQALPPRAGLSCYASQSPTLWSCQAENRNPPL